MEGIKGLVLFSEQEVPIEGGDIPPPQAIATCHMSLLPWEWILQPQFSIWKPLAPANTMLQSPDPPAEPFINSWPKETTKNHKVLLLFKSLHLGITVLKQWITNTAL